MASRSPLRFQKKTFSTSSLYFKNTQVPVVADFDKSNAPDKGISVWRSLFIGNELNERIESTRTSGYVTWLFMVAFLEGFNWKNAARWSPDFDNSSSPYNPFLMYAVASMTWILVVIIQLTWRKAMAVWFGLDITNFVDICSLSNVSIFMMDEPYHGYYIHGKTPAGKGDSCDTEMKFSLDEESRGLLPKRGLTPENPARGDIQCFEVYLPNQFKEHIFTFYKAIAEEQASLAGDRAGGGGMGGMFGGNKNSGNNSQLGNSGNNSGNFARQSTFGASQGGMGGGGGYGGGAGFAAGPQANIKRIAMLRFQMQEFILQMVDEVVKDQNLCIKKARGRNTFPNVDMPNFHTTFYEDPTGVQWTDMMSYGSEFYGFPTGFEWQVISLEFLVFSVLWRFTFNIYISVAVAFLAGKGIIRVRAMQGEKRLTQTALIDSRFLI